MARRMSLLLSILAATVCTVSAATVTGTVTDNAATPNPVAGAIVTVTPIGVGAAHSDTTDANGDYTITGVTAAAYPASFLVTATKSGYNMTNNFIRIAAGNSVVNQNITLVPRAAGQTISGIVTNASNANPIAGVKVVLVDAQGNDLDSSDTNNDGRYALDSVAQGIYSLVASKSGFATTTVRRVIVANTAVTQNIQLTAVVPSTLAGKVTRDSATGSAVVGATVIITQRFGGSFADTVTTDNNGWYSSSDLQIGTSYNIAVSMAGYTSRAVNHNEAAARDTVNITLMSIATGSLRVVVLKRSDSTAIAGASVNITRANGGTTLNATTGNNGWATFTDIAAGNYSVDAAMAGYTVGTGSVPVSRNGNDSLKLYLVVAALGTKSLTGTVRDSSTGTLLQNVKITLTVAGAGGGTLTFIDSTNASGVYFIAGIPANRTAGSLTATKSGYRNYTNNAVTIGQMNTPDTATLNIRMTSLVGVTAPLAPVMKKAAPDIISQGNMLVLRNMADNGLISLYSANGRLAYRSQFTARASSIVLPGQMTGTYLVSISQKGAIYRKLVVLR